MEGVGKAGRAPPAGQPLRVGQGGKYLRYWGGDVTGRAEGGHGVLRATGKGVLPKILHRTSADSESPYGST